MAGAAHHAGILSGAATMMRRLPMVRDGLNKHTDS
jgi:hypothetical protein